MEKHLKVLIVEDTISDSVTIGNFLRSSISSNITNVNTANTREGLQKVKGENFDLILSDIYWDGDPDVGLRFIHDVKRLPNSPIVYAMSISSAPKYDAIEAGASQFLEKPPNDLWVTCIRQEFFREEFLSSNEDHQNDRKIWIDIFILLIAFAVTVLLLAALSKQFSDLSLLAISFVALFVLVHC